MPTFSADYLVRLAGASGFRSDTLEKVLRLGRVLDQIARHPFLGDRLALKGGTALNLFFGARAPRLSVDLDFNYVRPVERDEMLREKEDIERTLGLVAGGDGYRLQWGAQEHAGRKTYLLYDAVGLAQGRWSHDHARLRRLFVILSAGLDRPLPTYEIPHRASLSQAEVAEALAPVLRGEERPRREALTAATGDHGPRHPVRSREGTRRAHPVGRLPPGAGRAGARPAGAGAPASDAALEGGERPEATPARPGWRTDGGRRGSAAISLAGRPVRGGGQRRERRRRRPTPGASPSPTPPRRGLRPTPGPTARGTWRARHPAAAGSRPLPG